MSERVDKVLVDLGILKTRSQAKMLIDQGCVFHNEIQVLKAGLKVEASDRFEVREKNIYVSRGAYKLEKAIELFQLNLKGKIVADIGASTGGFTEVSLSEGASRVYSIDVGHGQLVDSLRHNNKVINLEGINIKYPLELPEKVDLCVVDLSFISLRLVYENIHSLLSEKGYAVVLIKPQFEAGRQRLGKQGLVPQALQEVILNEVKQWFLNKSFHIESVIDSPIKGNKSGNKEYLALIKKQNN